MALALNYSIHASCHYVVRTQAEKLYAGFSQITTFYEIAKTVTVITFQGFNQYI